MIDSDKCKLFPNVRLMLKRDLFQVLAIEEANTQSPWTERDFRKFMGAKGNIGFVAEYREQIVGFCLYQYLPSKFCILLTELSVRNDVFRRGVGTVMFQHLVNMSKGLQVAKVNYFVLESNLTCQLFLRSQGFRAVRIHRGYYEEYDEDVYEMELCTASNRMTLPEFSVGNEA